LYGILTGRDAALLADLPDLLSSALEGALLQGLGRGGVAALGERTGTHAGNSIAEGNVALQLVGVVLLAGVGGGKAGKGRNSKLGKGNHGEREQSV
jgi:hypothetical protein